MKCPFFPSLELYEHLDRSERQTKSLTLDVLYLLLPPKHRNNLIATIPFANLLASMVSREYSFAEFVQSSLWNHLTWTFPSLPRIPEALLLALASHGLVDF